MRRREFITLIGGAAATWPLPALAQQPVRMRLIGVLMSLAQNDPGGQTEVEAFYQGLTALGWVEGRNIQIEFRWAGGNIERARILAKELIGLNPDVLLGRRDMRSQMGLVMNIVLGIIGAAVASWLLGFLGISLGGWVGYLIAGFIGACILIAIARAFSGGLQPRT